jgi:hypothetical protein
MAKTLEGFKAHVFKKTGRRISDKQALAVFTKALAAKGNAVGPTPGVDAEALRRVDLTTLPEDVSRFSCVTCRYFDAGRCRLPAIDGQRVTAKQCCNEWDAAGAVKVAGGGVETQEDIRKGWAEEAVAMRLFVYDYAGANAVEKVFGSGVTKDASGNWNESEHARAADGRFGNKPGSHGGSSPKKPGKGEKVTPMFIADRGEATRGKPISNDDDWREVRQWNTRQLPADDYHSFDAVTVPSGEAPVDGLTEDVERLLREKPASPSPAILGVLKRLLAELKAAPEGAVSVSIGDED